MYGKQLFGAIIAMHILQIAHIAQSFFSESGCNRNSYCLCCKLFSLTRLASGCIIKSPQADFVLFDMAAHKVFQVMFSETHFKNTHHTYPKQSSSLDYFYFILFFYQKKSLKTLAPYGTFLQKSLFCKNFIFQQHKKGNQYQMVIEDERGKNLFTQQQRQQQLVMINGKWNSI